MTERILVIDDELDMLVLLRMIIEENTAWDVVTTNIPSEGLKMVMEDDYKLVIADLKMPGIDGMEVFEEIKEMKPDIPVIIITAYGSLEIAEEARNKGVADFITTPFRKDTILFTMDRVLEIARLKREILELKKKLEEKSRS